jgi:hypothetical protein
MDWVGLDSETQGACPAQDLGQDMASWGMRFTDRSDKPFQDFQVKVMPE